MKLKKLLLKNFRLHLNTEVNFSNHLNYIIGGNGQGKTSILEAIYFLCTTKSFILQNDIEAVNFREKYFDISAFFEGYTEEKSRIYYCSDLNKKSVFINDKQIFRSSEIIGKFPVVTINQNDHEITKGAPAERRKFIDSILSQASETYLKLFIEYNKTLKHRASLLVKIKENYSKNLIEQLDAWSETLVNLGSELIKHRLEFIEEFNNYVKIAYQEIMENNEIPFIKYSTFGNFSKENIKEMFFEELNKRKDDELRRTVNLVGPHRDDLIFYINNYELKKYGSQGQNKTFIIALRFAQFFFLKDILNKKPIFLMDDVFGELDSFRAGKISQYLKQIGQAFITLTDFSNFEKLHKSEDDILLKVENGNVSYVQ